MKLCPPFRVLAVIFAAGLVHLPATAGACAACMGDVNSKIAPAMNDAIFLMLGCIGFMLASLAGFAIYLMKRSHAPVPPHVELAPMTNQQEATR
jgi:hypothetical protein